FSEWLGQVQNAYLQYQQLVQKSTDNYLKQVNIPTRDEISNVASLIINLEEKVENLDQKIEDELLANSASSEINKLKTSITKLDKKLDSILKAVQIPFETVPSSPAEDIKKNPNT
ncbi:MAG: poly(R)-hydroxyalkanoic acid synthase subunit PhaE, partial [Bacillota bacterium]|nr:poly(R)-hydroxyalkanoic acid synthase subunit PhaE [Bacillota bacterium]